MVQVVQRKILHTAPTVGQQRRCVCGFMAEHLGAPDTEEHHHAKKQEAFSSGALTWFTRRGTRHRAGRRLTGLQLRHRLAMLTF